MTTEQTNSTDTNLGNEPALHKFFRAAIKTQASDLHLKVGQPPKLRIQGLLKDTTGEVMTKETIEQMVFEILTPSQKETLINKGTLDFAYGIEDQERFRMNIFHQRGLTSLAARRVNTEILTFEKLNLPSIFENICDTNQGLVLAVGPTGCGKTTTMVSMLDYINSNRSCHIVTIEDPIEYLIRDKKAIVSQREIGIDVEDFEQALKYLMRQDPDVVCIAEMRDVKSITAGMRAAETGHLVFGTMHSSNATHAVQRLLDLFPSNERDLARQTLSVAIKAVISQVLMPSIKEGVDRIPAVEILLANPTTRKLIHEGREPELPILIRSCKEEGMQDFTDNLVEMIQNGSIEPKEAYKHAPNVDELKMALKGIRADTTGIL
jgi:twitching motility protein PilT